MPHSDDKYKKALAVPEEEDDSESGQGGQGSQVAFRDFLDSGEHIRDDLLSPEEKRRLLAVHGNTHEFRVQQQKERREHYKAVKEGKVSTHRYGMSGMGMHSPYRQNPILANKAQFSGIDRQVNALPTENDADINRDHREEYSLKFQHRLEHRLTNEFKFNPPKLTRS